MTNSALRLRARRFLEAVGYSHDLLLEQYPVWIPGPKTVELADLVAFGRSAPKDMTTALVVVGLNGLDSAHRVARALGAPFVVRPQDAGFGLQMVENNSLKPWRVVDDHSVSEVRPILQPEAATRAKLGLRQLPLFDIPVNFLTAARRDSRESLGGIVSEALTSTVSALAADGEPASAPPHRNRGEAARLVVGALTALVARDTDPTTENAHAHDSEAIIERAAHIYPDTFAWLRNSSAKERDIFIDLTTQLGEGINYRSMDPTVLCSVYEHALVNANKRSELGIHYTPPDLAARVLASLPIEFIDPEDRHVLDPTCGSGSLLIAAHERLASLQPKHLALEAQHRELQRHLRGFDLDEFAAEIARLALLLKSQPAGNGWSIDAVDTLKVKGLQTRPHIIVMNPPWRLERTKKLQQIADDFIKWSADALAPGGLLGAIVPTSWLSTESSSEVRQHIRDAFEVFEVWRLPGNTFSTSSQSPAVILARKHHGSPNSGCRVVRHIRPSERDKFLESRQSSVSFIIGHTSCPLSKSLPMLEFSARTQRLEAIADVITGLQRKASTEARENGTPYLQRFGDVQPYSLIPDSALRNYDLDKDFQADRGRSIVDKRKILVSATRSSDSPWRYKVAMDLRGVACSNTMHGIAPNRQTDDDMLHSLLAIVGSGFASAFSATFGHDRHNRTSVLKSLPIPTTDEAIKLLATLARRAVECAHDQTHLHRVLADIEDAVWEIYGVSTESREKAIRLLAGQQAPERRIRYTAVEAEIYSERSSMRRVGTIHEVQGSHVRIWINGITPNSGITVPVPTQMPGWLIRPGATFDARRIDTVDDIANATFEFQPRSWQTHGFAEVHELTSEG